MTPAAPVATLARVALTAGFVLPLVPLLVWAAADQWSAPDLLPQRWGLSGWRSALEQGAAGALGRSVLVALSVTAIAVPTGAMAARGLVLARLPAAGLLTAALLAPVAVPGLAVALGLDVLLIRSGLPATPAVVLVLAAAATPYTTYVMRAAYGAYDTGYEDEARTLGAGARQVMLRLRLPLLAAPLAASALLAFLVGWSDYAVTLLLGGGRLVTLPLLIASSASAVGNEAVVAVTSLVALLPPLVLLLTVRRVAQGLA